MFKRGLHTIPLSRNAFIHHSPSSFEILELAEILQNVKNLVCITGAGVSTSSGLPDYRGENGSYKRGHKPMVHAEFIGKHDARQRYWSRSMVGFERVLMSSPNDCHKALANLEKHNKLKLVITQNVDRLHQSAGSSNVIDLHGRIDENICLNCATISSREAFQHQLHTMNPHFSQLLASNRLDTSEVRADGDVDLTYDYLQFNVPVCSVCGGIVKPNVVFFGDNVPTKKVEQAYQQIDKCDGLLVVGTSLEVFSAYKFVLRVDKRGGVPIAIVNHGETRAERSKIASIQYKSDANCGTLLKGVAKILCEH